MPMWQAPINRKNCNWGAKAAPGWFPALAEDQNGTHFCVLRIFM